MIDAAITLDRQLNLSTPTAPVQQAYIPAQRTAAAEEVEPEPAAAVNPG
jgi:hypothetical protein